MDKYVDVKGSEQPERRKHANLRGVFDDVVRRVAPFFQDGGKLNGSRTDFWVTRTISDAYSELSNEEVHVLANAAARYYSERK